MKLGLSFPVDGFLLRRRGRVGEGRDGIRAGEGFCRQGSWEVTSTVY